MNEKWNIQNRKRLSQDSCTVNIKAKEILALDVTNEKVHDGRRILTKLVNSYVNK